MKEKGGIESYAGREVDPRRHRTNGRRGAAFRSTAGAFIMVAAALFFASCGRGTGDASAAKDEAVSVPVRVLPLVPRDFVEYGEYYGRVTPVREATLQSVAGGRVDAVLAVPGDRVHAGQSLAHIEAERAQSLYDTAILNERVTRQRYELQRELQTAGSASGAAVDQAHLAWLQSRTTLIDAEKALAGAFAVSPIDGVVIARYIEPYDDLDPGDATFSVADTSKMKVTVGLPEADIAGVGELYSAEVRLASIPDRVWQGTPVFIARKPSDSTRAYEVRVLVDNPDGLMLAGTTATVKVGLRRLTAKIVVPTSALRSEGDLTYVMVANSPTARKKPVTTGPSNLTETVIETGLASGDELIIEGINRVRDGDRVDVRG